MIPKTIHYCWFGKGELPDLAKKSIESWKKYCPDYKIIEWNESNFDVNSNIYTKEAYAAKKYAFVTDYVRLYVLDKYGGIYMDTDVEVIKSLDCFLEHQAFSGFENDFYIPTAIMGSQKNNSWISFLLSYYQGIRFIKDDGTFDLTTNCVTITNMTKKKYKFELNNQMQSIKAGVVLYPNDFFCPKSYKTGVIKCTRNTYVIHHFNGSWLSKREQEIKAREVKFRKLLGDKMGHYVNRRLASLEKSICKRFKQLKST